MQVNHFRDGFLFKNEDEFDASLTSGGLDHEIKLKEYSISIFMQFISGMFCAKYLYLPFFTQQRGRNITISIDPKEYRKTFFPFIVEASRIIEVNFL